MATVPAPQARSRSIQVKHVFFIIYGLMTLFVLYRYEMPFLDSQSPIWQHFAKVKWWLLPHGLLGAIALFIAPFQFSNRLRQRHLRLHRILGRIYVAGVAVSAPVAVRYGFHLCPCHYRHSGNCPPGRTRRCFRGLDLHCSGVLHPNLCDQLARCVSDQEALCSWGQNPCCSRYGGQQSGANQRLKVRSGKECETRILGQAEIDGDVGLCFHRVAISQIGLVAPLFHGFIGSLPEKQ